MVLSYQFFTFSLNLNICFTELIARLTQHEHLTFVNFSGRFFLCTN